MKNIILVLATVLLPMMLLAQNNIGIITDINGQKITNSTITNLRTGQKISSDNLGQYNLDWIIVNDKYRFQKLGYKTLELIGEIDNLRLVIMDSEINTLDEVQIIGYGTSIKRHTLGSITSIKSQDLEYSGINNPLAALQGRVPGLVISNTSGLPGASMKVQIRGQNSLKTDMLSSIQPLDQPFFVIDGVPFAPQNDNMNQFSSVISPGAGDRYNNPYGGISPFSLINTQDIESIEILRDADATAIYGSRGANGVILITTKKGVLGSPKFTINHTSGISSVGNMITMMNTEDYLQMRREAFANDNIEPNTILYDLGYAPDILLFDNNSDTNWTSYLLSKNARQNSTNIAVSGGDNGVSFKINGFHNYLGSVFPGDYNENKGGGSVGINFGMPEDTFKLNLNASYISSMNKSSSSLNMLSTFVLPPNYPTELVKNNELVWSYNDVSLNGQYVPTNPYASLLNLYSMSSRMLNTNINLSYTLAEKFSFSTNLGYNEVNSDEYSNVPKKSQPLEWTPISSAKFGKNRLSAFIIEPQFDYKNHLDFFAYSLLLGASLQLNSSKSDQLEGYGYQNDELLTSINGAATRYASDNFSNYKYMGIFARFSGRIKDEYLINISGRRDGSSRFGKNKQFGNFGSIGVGWLFNENQFIKDSFSWLSFGKLRATYGLTGSDQIGNYNYISRWRSTNIPYDGITGYVPANLENPFFSWGTTNKLELGTDIGLNRNRLLFGLSYYRNVSGDQLVNYRLPMMTGFNSVVDNWDAKVKNSGFESYLQAQMIVKSDFNWTLSFNFTIPKNKLIAFPNIENSSYATEYVIGRSVNAIHKFKSAGVNSSTGLFKFYDYQGNITDEPKRPNNGNFNDFVYVGHLDPEFFGGLQNKIRIRNFTLDFTLDFRMQKGINYLSQVYSYLPGQLYNQPKSILNRWQKEGDVTQIQMFSTQYGEAYTSAQNFMQSNGIYGDASYIKFRTITFQYNINKLLRKWGIKNSIITLNANNLFTMSKYEGNDPESQNLYGMPVLRSVVGGLNFTF